MAEIEHTTKIQEQIGKIKIYDNKNYRCFNKRKNEERWRRKKIWKNARIIRKEEMEYEEGEEQWQNKRKPEPFEKKKKERKKKSRWIIKKIWKKVRTIWKEEKERKMKESKERKHERKLEAFESKKRNKNEENMKRS